MIRIASPEERQAASDLVRRRYSEQGWEDDFSIPAHAVTFVATKVIGTLSLTTQRPFLADKVYKAEVDALLASGARVCELARFAAEPGVNILDGLWDFLEAREHDFTDLLIEVHDRHRRFYERRFRFELMASRVQPGMKRPTHLLRLRLCPRAVVTAA